MNRIVFFGGIIAVIFSFSCKRTTETLVVVNPVINNEVNKMSDLVVPVGFTWENSHDVNFNIGITDTRFQDAVHVISIYDANPVAGGNLIARGSATVSNAFTAKLYMAKTITSVYIVKTSPDNSEIWEQAAITGANVNVQLGYTIKQGKMSKTASPNCSSGCNRIISRNTSFVSVASGTTLCVTGNNITISFSSVGGTVTICGTNVTVSNSSLHGNSTLIISSGASVTFSNLNQTSTLTSFKNWGTANFEDTYSPIGSVLNEGTINITGDYDVNTQSQQTNNGTINVGKSMRVNGNTTIVNNGLIATNEDLEINGQGLFINNCRLWIKRDFNHNNIMQNYSYVRVDRETSVKDVAELGMYNGAMFRTLDMTLNGTVKGYSNTSLVKVNGQTTINGGGSVVNAIQYCDANGLETNNGTIGSGATQSCTLYLPITACNMEGNGTLPPLTDADGDGVADANDAYPTDPTRAYNNYYPSASGVASVAFEDLWPSKGDYDLNDIVVTYRYNIVTNTANNVAQVIGSFTLHATGGSFESGFGVEFPIDRAKATSLVGGTLEAGQTKAVVTLFNNSHNQMTTWNTVPGAAASDTINYNFSFNVTAGPSLAAFGLNQYNPFIWNNTSGFGRGYEIHLPGQAPTNLANSAIFRTSDDNTNVAAGRYYQSKGNGLPWAIAIPVKFAHPIEKADINTAYLKFATWVQSGGTQFADWYSNTTGYRDATKIYVRP